MAAVVRSLLVLQAAFALTATLGLVALMAFNPAYAVVPALYATALFTLAALLPRRWALWTVLAVEGLALCGFWLQQVAALLPQLGSTVNLTAVLTTIVLPAAVLALTLRLLAAPVPVAR
ncbi:hypothetical protein KZZ52_12840 [Dactylosporangium sp. AC04546]|uniref:hypothetical protein n=1 Tax=Dactylosporangium sp. AC04546 TaxID=2862460 RepID=UPI001EE11FF5|nr:hypothetical protein [Dactylosporangium sp. AC04546]WVK86225.1 hypothetical protein KZZ52_12840 [Dactylosporangium sp. AC04546]